MLRKFLSHPKPESTMDHTKCRVLLFSGDGLISKLIKWQTRSIFSHVGVLTDDGKVLEAIEGSGVRIRDWAEEDKRNTVQFTVDGLGQEGWEKTIAFMKAQIGKKYDWWAIIRFVSRRYMPDNDHWFCSELVFTAVREGGVHLLRRIRPSEVSPGGLSTSPLLRSAE